MKHYKVAKEFYRDLCGTYNGNANKTCHGIASVEHIAEIMGMPVSETQEFCDAMVYHGITEKQNGMYVI